MTEQNGLVFVSGLYFDNKTGENTPPLKIISELEQSLKLNAWYRDNLICYADSKEMAKVLTSNGLYVHKIFDDAPLYVQEAKKHKMKHWIMLNAVKEFKDVVWIDWDTYNLKPIDDNFVKKCLSSVNPKFTYIQNYWATVNCAVYYLNIAYEEIMQKSFQIPVPEPNDELLWRNVLPNDILELPDFWLDDFVINIWLDQDFDDITENTYFLHLKNFEMLNNRFSKF